MIDTIAYHPAANLFPLMEGDEFAALVADIAEHGQLEPIVIHDGMILDGRNRYRACVELGLKPILREWNNHSDPIAYVVSLNLHRRHLNESQRALIGARIANMPSGRRTDIQPTANLQEVSRSNAADMVNVSERSVNNAAKVLREAEPEVIEAVEKGLLPVSTAAGIMDGSPEFQRAIAERVISGEKPVDAIRETRRADILHGLEDIEAKRAKEIQGVFDVIVIDPPWPMQKIERDERPNQSEFAYPTMTENELAALDIPHADNCHVWVWTTHKYLPMALRLLDKWGMQYICTFVWHKPGGFQPYGLPQYNCEFAIYARYGSPQFIDTKAFNVCFDAPRGGHSEKPDAFYDVTRRVTAGRRLDMFGRRSIDGFESWGNEAPNG